MLRHFAAHPVIAGVRAARLAIRCARDGAAGQGQLDDEQTQDEGDGTAKQAHARSVGGQCGGTPGDRQRVFHVFNCRVLVRAAESGGPYVGVGGSPTPTAGADAQSVSRRSSCALTATMIVLSDMSTAPTAGERTIPHGASTPAASGIATML